MINYTDALRLHNLKATPQRLAIADTLHMRGHVSLESLYAIMVEKFSSISLATIYKNINIMLLNSFIQEVKLPNTKSVYELTKTTHSHLLCNRCESVEDISIDLDSIVKEASSRSHFEIQKTDLVFSGLCSNCK